MRIVILRRLLSLRNKRDKKETNTVVPHYENDIAIQTTDTVVDYTTLCNKWNWTRRRKIHTPVDTIT